MEREIGQVFEYRNTTLKVVEDVLDESGLRGCEQCYFLKGDQCARREIIMPLGYCVKSLREDKKGVHFEEVESDSHKENQSKIKIEFLDGRIQEQTFDTFKKSEDGYYLQIWKSNEGSLSKYSFINIAKVFVIGADKKESLIYPSSVPNQEEPKKEKGVVPPEQITVMADLDRVQNGHGLFLKYYKDNSGDEYCNVHDAKKKVYFTIRKLTEKNVEKLNLFGFNVVKTFNLDSFLKEYVKPCLATSSDRIALEVENNGLNLKFYPIANMSPTLFNTLYFHIDDVDYVNKVIFKENKVPFGRLIRSFIDLGWV